MFFEVIQFFLSPIYTFFDPYLSRFTDALTSQKTQRVAVKSIFVSVVTVTLVSVALTAYLAFYWAYVPKISHEKQIFLQYHEQTLPYALVDFVPPGSNFLTADQAYDVTLHLYVPNSYANKQLGNFMVDLELKSLPSNETVQHTKRPVRLNFQSGLLEFFSTMVNLLPLLMGYAKEDQRLHVKLLENMIESPDKRVTRAYITISQPLLETYQVKIRFDAHFRGLRYFMYYHPITTACAFITFFLFWEILCSFIAWNQFVSWLQNQRRQTVPSKPKKQKDGAGRGTGRTAKGAEDEEWERVSGDLDRHQRSEVENGTTTDADSEFEGQSRSGSVFGNARNAPSRPYSESGETSYTTESYVTDGDEHSVVSGRTQDDVTDTEDSDVVQTEGSVTPTRSRRTSVSGVSTVTTDDDYDIQDRPAALSTARTSGSQAYSRRVQGSGVGGNSH